MKILQYPEDQKLLRNPGKIVTPEIVQTETFKNELQQFLTALKEEGDGIGLAATQVGWPYQIFALSRDENLEEIAEPRVYLNPRILSVTKESKKDEEGCLSFRGLFLKVGRPISLDWEYQDLEFQTHKKTSTGYFARVIFHETDHLAGRLFIDQVSNVEKLKVERWLKNR